MKRFLALFQRTRQIDFRDSNDAGGGIKPTVMIRQKSPKSKIVFLTLVNDRDVMKAALDFGQTTYVQKAKAATRVCDAVAASLGQIQHGIGRYQRRQTLFANRQCLSSITKRRPPQ